MSSKQSNIFFRFEPKQTKTQFVSVVFRFVSRNQKTFFLFFSVFRTGIEITETNRISSKQTEKISKQTFSIKGSSKPLIFFLGSNRNSFCFGCFSVCFLRNQQIFFRFVSMFRTGSETTGTNRTYGMGS